MARARDFTPETISDFVCRLSGGRSLAAVCRDADMPVRRDVYKAMAADPAFRGMVEAVRDRATRGRAPGGKRRGMWSEALAEAILLALREGFSLEEICRSPACPVGASTVYAWLKKRPAFAAAYREACAPRATEEGLRIGRGRRGGYDPQLAATIAERLTEGRSLLSISRDPDVPGTGTLAEWRARHPAFALAMQRARRAQAEVLLDAVIEAIDVPHRRGPAARLLAALWRRGHRPYAGQPIEQGTRNWAATVADGARRERGRGAKRRAASLAATSAGRRQGA